MDPITIGLGLAKLTGLDDKLCGWLKGRNGGDVANKLISVAQSVTGVASPAQALKDLAISPTLSEEYKALILEQELSLKTLANADRADARAMQVEALRSKDRFARRFIYYFAAAWSLFAFAILPAIIFCPIPDKNLRFADTLIGFLLGTVLAGMFAYFFGSSEGNERRNEQEDLSKALRDRPIE